ncbi:MAG: alanine racemase [Deltaproteobacteria bacterium]|jgi:diaminopimelate decarboxylase|nr:alanine racemase [Deltaproteobacteria bacterium]MBW2533570.1 alanine racemase [Deltaproteobacteria bacterium]
MKPRYERPVIVRHAMGGWDKFGAAKALRPMRSFGGAPLAELVETYGSPLFVFSEKILRERIGELKDQLARRFSDFTIAWSYKTNYLGAICEVFHQEGAWAEVVSGFELEKALRAGVPGTEIAFNGPGKSDDDLELAFREGVHVHIDHLDELAQAERVAERLGLRPEVSIRVNIANLPVDKWDRFGFTLENGRALQAVRRLLRGDRLELTGLHCHIGTFILNPDAYRAQAKALAELAGQLSEEHGLTIRTIDVGGGFASHNTLLQQYLPGEEITPSFGQYVEQLALGFEEGIGGRPMPRVVLETGRALVDDAAILVSTVIANKRLVDGRRAVVIDAGVNILPTAWWYRHDVTPAQETRGVAEPTVFFGPLCMNIDVVRQGVMFPPLRPGDRVVIGHVGAYNVTQWMQFITARPNVVLVSTTGEHGLIRRAETVDTLLAQEEMPAWLRP